ncbi:MAG: MltA domain-containing protein, partial [Pseudomonadota bacterium]
MGDRRAAQFHRKAPLAAALGLTTLVLAACGAGAAKKAPDANALDRDLVAQVDQALESLNLERYDAPNVNISFQKVAFNALAGWENDDHGAALLAFQRSCRKLNRLKRTTVLGGLASRIEDWRPSCQAAESVTPGAARAFFELAFTPVRIDPDDTAKVTSYYEPILEARKRPTGRFVHPIYAKPREITFKNGKYGVASGSGVRASHTRAAIYNGALDGRGLEIAYLADPVDLFFLQIQGSGMLRFPGGESLRVGFAA